MSISSIPSLTSYLPATSTTNKTSSSLGQALISAVTNSNSTNSTPSVQDTVSLSNSSDIVNTLTGGSSSSSQAYTPQGLLNSYYSLLENNAVNDPLLQTDSSTSSPIDALTVSPSSLPSALTGTASSNKDTTSTQTGTGTNASSNPNSSTIDINSSWAAAIKQNPSLTSQVIHDSLNQGIVNTFA